MPSKKNSPTSASKTKLSDLPDTLATLVTFLREKGGTASAIANNKSTRCSKPTAYARVEALASHGYTCNVEEVREGSKGPLARSFSLPKR